MLILEMSSFSNAKQEFGQEVAVYWAQFDFLKNKRYVKKMCDLYYKDKIPQNEITKIFFDYQENEEWFNAMGINFNTLTWEQLKENAIHYTAVEYRNLDTCKIRTVRPLRGRYMGGRIPFRRPAAIGYDAM